MRLDQLRFDVRHVYPTTLRLLFRHLGFRDSLRTLIAFARRMVREDPFADLGPAANRGEAFTRHQLAPLLLMDAVLREDLKLPAGQVRLLLEELVGATGTIFIGQAFGAISPARWRTMSNEQRVAAARAVFARFENSEGVPGDVGPDHFDFDVTYCHYAALTQRIGRPDLAPLFCHADSVYFGRPESSIRLERDETLARGDRRCGFRFRYEASAKAHER